MLNISRYFYNNTILFQVLVLKARRAAATMERQALSTLVSLLKM